MATSVGVIILFTPPLGWVGFYPVIVFDFYLSWKPLFGRQQRISLALIFFSCPECRSILAMSTFNNVLSISVAGHLTFTEHSVRLAEETVHSVKDLT